MLQNSQTLQTTKNLLAFSAGGDSTALFFLLLEHKITFDIAIVDYGMREQSKEEVSYARELAKKYNLECFVHTAAKIEKNFEANARAIRYDFFEVLIEKYSYNILLTAHHLGDRLEWMLMQFCKGAGVVEFAGMQGFDKRNTYSLARPLLHLEKSELIEYLQKNEIKYFEDESNSDEKYKRNEFRHRYANPLLKSYKEGIKKSFEYIDADRAELIVESKIEQCNELFYFVSSNSWRSNIYYIDRYFKSIGILLSHHEKYSLKEKDSFVISRKYIVSFWKGYILIAPFIEGVKMTKIFKERMRKLKIEPKMRAYLATDPEAVELLSLLLQ